MRKRGQHRRLGDVTEADDGVTNFLFHAFCSLKFSNMVIALNKEQILFISDGAQKCGLLVFRGKRDCTIRRTGPTQ